MALIEKENETQGPQEQQKTTTAVVPILHINNIYKSSNYNSNSGSANDPETRKKNSRLISTHDVISGLELKINEGEFEQSSGPQDAAKVLC